MLAEDETDENSAPRMHTLLVQKQEKGRLVHVHLRCHTHQQFTKLMKPQ